MIWVGEKPRDVFNTWNLTEDESKLLCHVLRQVRKPKSNKVFTCYKFQNKIQQEKESFEQFLTDILKLLVKDCGYVDPDEMVWDRGVVGCHSQKVHEKLIQKGSKLALEKAINITRTQVMSNQQLYGARCNMLLHSEHSKALESNKNSRNLKQSWNHILVIVHLSSAEWSEA